MPRDERQDAIDVCRVLSVLVADLVMGVRLFQIYKHSALSRFVDDMSMQYARRIHMSSLVVTLSKYAELYDRYKYLMPEDVAQHAKELRRRVQDLGVVEFRNKVVGHVLDRRSNRPLSTDETNARFHKILGAGEDEFLAWINNPDNNTVANTVVGTVEALKIRISEERDVNPEDIE